jgi:hypothetical protein
VLAFLHDGGEGRAERHRDSGEEGGGANDTLGFTHTGCSCASSDRCSLVVQRPCRALLASSMRVPGAVAVECANGAAVCKQFIENMPPSTRDTPSSSRVSHQCKHHSEPCNLCRHFTVGRVLAGGGRRARPHWLKNEEEGARGEVKGQWRSVADQVSVHPLWVCAAWPSAQFDFSS